jgi:hypothetical protein
MHPPIEISKTVPSPLHFAARKRQEEVNGNPQMLTTIEHLHRITASQPESLETEATGLTMERGNASERLQPFSST